MDLSSTELDFFAGDGPKLAIYLRLRETLAAIAPGCEVRVHKTTISFRAPRPYVYVSFPFRKHYKHWPEDHLLISFASDSPIDHPHVAQSTFIRNNLYTIHAIVLPPGTLAPGLEALVKQSHQKRNPKEQA